MALKLRPQALLAGLPLALALMLTGCADNTTEVVTLPEPEPVVTAEPTTEPAPVAPETNEPAGAEDTYPARWPLTGVGTQEVADRPALLVKVENSNIARPQEGLEYADVLYEVVVEGGITRYIAVYHSELPEQILPVRSARPSDIPIVTPYGGLFAYSGAQGPFIQAINAAGNQSLIFDSGVPGLARVAGRSAPHNVAGNPITLLNQANATRVSPPQGGMPFALDVAGSSAAENGNPVGTIDVRMSNIQRSVFTWDAGTGRFLRSDGATPSVQVSGARLSAVNVVLLAADYVNSDIPGTSAVPTAVLTGSGRALFAADGKYIEGTWQKGGPADPFTFLDSNGQPVIFAPGNTFVQIVPDMAGGWQLN